MQWYMAKMIYRIITGEGQHTPQFDEQLRLIRASSTAEAFERSLCTGRSNEFSFINEKKQAVKWEFIDIAELYKLPGLNDGAEIHSRLSETDNAGTFIDIVHRKAEQIRSSASVFSTETR